MLAGLKDKIVDIGFNRCGNCPAHWASVDYWGEGDEGCTIYRDNLEFCSLSLLPQFVMKPYVKLKEKQDEKRFLKMYQDDIEAEKENES